MVATNTPERVEVTAEDREAGEKVERLSDAPGSLYGAIGVEMFKADFAGLKAPDAIALVGNAVWRFFTEWNTRKQAEARPCARSGAEGGPVAEIARVLESAAKVAEDHAPHRNGSVSDLSARVTAQNIASAIRALSPTQDGAALEGVLATNEDVLAKALCLLDTLAGEGLHHVYGNGTILDAADVCNELCEAAGIELEPGWYRKFAAVLATVPRQEPVAWMYRRKSDGWTWVDEQRDPAGLPPGSDTWTETPLYAHPPTTPSPDTTQSQRGAGECGAVSEDAIRHLEIRSPLNRAIYKAVRGYDMSNMTDADDPMWPYPLVDLMSNEAPADIGTGEMEMIALADEIEAAVKDLYALTTPSPAPEADVERVREALNRALEFYCMTLAFIRRDEGTERLPATLNGLCKLAIEGEKQARAAIAAMPPREDWRPIEEAPKDGTPILAYYGESKDEDICDLAIVMFDEEGLCRLCEYPHEETIEPTHWQPLPSPPTGENRRGS